MQTHSKTSTLILVLSSVMAFLAILGGSAAAHHVEGEVGVVAAVPSESCATCHSTEYDAWKNSDHGWALREPSETNVLGDFDDAGFELNGETSTFHRKDGDHYIRTPGPEGELKDYEVKFTVGVEPLQQYLLEIEEGRLQAFDVAWDTTRNRWFHLYPEQNLEPGDGLHWTGPYKNWNGRCAECHQTDYVKGYDPQEQVFESEWSELTIGCGACHGPGAEHLKWAENPAAYQPELAATKGFEVTRPMQSSLDEVQQCAGCHSRRSPLSANSPHVGAEYNDTYKLALLRDGLYHPDGQIDDEVYVYGSFLQSKMFANGVTCSNCHDPHSGELVAQGNDTCTQCHSDTASDGFPSLQKAIYDDPSHHRHEPGTDSALCVSCHMPSKNFMQVDPRRDHSFRVPRPDLSTELGSPNACTICHEGQSNEWAASKVKEWFPDGRSGTYHYGQTLARGREIQSPQVNAELVDLALDVTHAAIVRASAIDLARASLTEESFNRMLPLLDDESDLVRGVTLQMMERVPAGMRAQYAVAMLDDPALSVRLEAARLLTGQQLDGLDTTDRAAFDRGMADFQKSLAGRTDFPETQLQIAGLAMVLRDFESAKSAFRTATSMDPQLEQAWITLARIQEAQEQPAEAEKTLTEAAANIPDSAEVQNQLGALYFRTRQNAKSAEALERSISIMPPTPDLLDLLSNNYYELGDVQKAIDTAKELVATFPTYEPSELTRRLLTLKVLER